MLRFLRIIDTHRALETIFYGRDGKINTHIGEVTLQRTYSWLKKSGVNIFKQQNKTNSHHNDSFYAELKHLSIFSFPFPFGHWGSYIQCQT